ncbi:phosphate ABC transporter permease subunit PstC [Phragmitibacter flavus]|uniref:Phosphate transport system permease protein n=1 Tax=Phragmitibacter flavus TaxID=2576071 RepID=A0A5R8KE67_9BACT|nr:phosphate ABC transporter permease subunit PstC [Phragmitibacter flavus]TLD70570.1 phosphate ABC transporter permease subunit PstC [Phragmitibacter flavus]
MTRFFCWVFSLLALLAFGGLLAVFLWQSLPVWQAEGVGYVTKNRWFFRQQEFGAAAMIYGSAMVALVALLVAAPLGLGTAVLMSEYLPNRLRWGMKVLVELLAGVPSVVYGLLGILLLREWVYDSFEAFDLLSGDTLLTAGLLLAVMVLPTVVTLGDDALRAVPSTQRRAARGLGLTRAEVVGSVALPQAARGMGAALLLGFGRALGETVAVFLVVGRQDNQLPERWWSMQPLLESGQTLTSKLGGAETSIAYADDLHWGAMMGLGVLLLVLTGVVTLLGTIFRSRRNANA